MTDGSAAEDNEGMKKTWHNQVSSMSKAGQGVQAEFIAEAIQGL